MATSKSKLTGQAMLVGALTGGLIGAIARGGFTFYNLQEGQVFGLIAALPSAGIGMLCGAIAGLTSGFVVGLLLGGFLSAFLFVLFMMPLAYLFSGFEATGKLAEFSWPLFLQKAFAGALAGGIGGLAGSQFREKEPLVDKRPS